MPLYNTVKWRNSKNRTGKGSERGARAMEPERDTLYMQCFGSFSLSWNGETIRNLSRTRESQFILLLELVLHFRERGISRETLCEILFADREVQNEAHSLQVLLYTFKKKLRAAGLPDTEYITNRRGVFYWTSEIPVVEDADCFLQLCEAAEANEDKRERLRLSLEAIELYTGEFLSAQGAQLWVAQEARRYERAYTACVERAAGLLRADRDWPRLEKLGRRAARTQPFLNWERFTVEALLAMGRGEEARRLYQKVERYYRSKMNLTPDGSLAELLDSARTEEALPVRALEQIAQRLNEAEPGEEGGTIFTFPSFERLYRFMLRTGLRAWLMGCAIGGSSAGAQPVDAADAIRLALRPGDMLAPYGGGQFLALLLNASREDCGEVRRRIEARLAPSGRATFYFLRVGGESADEEGREA